MDANISRDVTDLFTRDKESLEHLLGTSLNEAQKVFITAYTPGKEPDRSTQMHAADVIETILDASAKHAREHGVSDDQIDEAVDEAIDLVRRRKPL